ncbi:MAG: hypothetical protein EOL95_08810 [Bacteroidia bacterium]|nr:hypothetical protein [Bacteroidia bacterium]
MPKLDGTGPQGQGSGTGRKIGNCDIYTEEEKLKILGIGMGKRRKAGGGEGKKERFKSGNDL